MRSKEVRTVRDDRKGKIGTRVEKPMIRGMWGREDLLLKMGESKMDSNTGAILETEGDEEKIETPVLCSVGWKEIPVWGRKGRT